jgi:tetratricopeptide (TPR) repeat protein
MYKLSHLFIVLALVIFGLAPVHADGGSAGRDSPLAPFKKLIDDQKYQQAITELDKALEDEPDNADLLNLMAYSQRQLKHYEIALECYQKALQVEPRHRGANEYLGELYLQIGQLDKAEERLEVLDKECFFGCKEFDELEQAIADYRKQNPS